MANINKKIIAIVGTTASGKTSLAVDLACRFNGEIVSADSRQVYKYMDIGTGKDLDEYLIKSKIGNRKSAIENHCIDLIHPNTEFSLSKWYKKAVKAVDDIQSRGRLPILAGGTGLYTQALVDGFQLSDVKPNKKLRKQLEKLSVNALFKKLEKLNCKFAGNLHESDQKNKRRLIRYIEIAGQGTRIGERESIFDSLIIGLTWPKDILKERIEKRLVERLEKENMVKEVENLHKKYHVSWKRLNGFGLEYKYVTLYLKGNIKYDEMVEQLSRAIYQFSRRQMNWLRRWERQGAKINWAKNSKQTAALVKKFINQ